jgi:hypothetical protein
MDEKTQEREDLGFCPLTKSLCREDCRWLYSGEVCAIAFLGMWAEDEWARKNGLTS